MTCDFWRSTISAPPKHTLGPLCIPAGEGNEHVVCEGDSPSKPGRIAFVVRPAMGTSNPSTYDELAAYARLSATAPSLLMALKGARDAIAKAPEDTWGTDAQGDPSVPGGYVEWPIRDEILHHIDATIDKAEGR